MKSFIFEFLCLLVAASARRSAPESPPRAFFPTGYPYGWGMPHPTLIDPPVEKPKEEKNVKEVKRVVKNPKDVAVKAKLHDLRWAAVQDMMDGLE
mmetsp:Transcript_6068/g.12171  ORF Transcript_6068/g.12171 Transcript_6068/m.12171 type:complete len:95 (-) Transcript_6068:99-383(-)